MSHSSSQKIESAIEELFLKSLGWNISLDDKYSIEKMQIICNKMGFSKIEECILSFSQNLHSEELIQNLADKFSIGESYFFRDKNFFNTFEYKILPEILKNNDKTINIWSAGCSSGEEAYSIAMILNKNIPDIKNWDINILGTDINTSFLEKAKRGIYAHASFRDIPEYYKKKYFIQLEKEYEILPLIRDMVHFSYHNIAQKTHPVFSKNKNFDLIILRNILLYFNREKAKEVVDFLYNHLKPGRWLSTTPAEYSSNIFDSYRRDNFSKDFLIQKSTHANLELITHQEHSLASNTPKTEQYVEDPFPKEAIPDNETIKDTTTDKTQKTFSIEKNLSSSYLKASELIELGELQEAKKYLVKTLYLDSNFIVGLIALGNVLKKEGKHDEHLRYINKAINLLSQMEPSTLVPNSNDMTAHEILSVITHIQHPDEGLKYANN